MINFAEPVMPVIIGIAYLQIFIYVYKAIELIYRNIMFEMSIRK